MRTPHPGEKEPRLRRGLLDADLAGVDLLDDRPDVGRVPHAPGQLLGIEPDAGIEHQQCIPNVG
jgi:hypothetical protein